MNGEASSNSNGVTSNPIIAETANVPPKGSSKITMDQSTYKKPTKIYPNQNNNKTSLIQKPEVVNLENFDYDIEQFKDMSINLNYD